MRSPFLVPLLTTAALALPLISCTPTTAVQPTPASSIQSANAALQRNDYESADRYFRAAIAANPDGESAAYSRDMLREMNGARLYPEVAEPCPAEAWQSFHTAEEDFGAGDFDAASELFRKAADACPGSATIRVSWADTFYAQRDYAKASAVFREAVALDPWNRMAWRYLADSEAELGHANAAWEAALFAVLSDPSYEMAWMSLRRYSGAPVRRVYADQPRCEQTPDKPLAITLNAQQPEQQEWMDFALTCVTADAALGTPLEKMRMRVDSVLHGRSGPAQTQMNPGFWDNMLAAKDAGFLDEAIFVNLIDTDLAPEYAKYRDAHRDRLVAYMKKLVTTPPPSFPSRAT